MGGVDPPQEGMSKRLWIATQIAAAIYNQVMLDTPKEAVEHVENITTSLAYSLTDELLKQENE